MGQWETLSHQPLLMEVINNIYNSLTFNLVNSVTNFINAVIDRKALSACVLGNEVAMRALEEIVHPLVSQERNNFLCEVCY